VAAYRPKKRLGQHFLRSPHVIQSILDLLQCGPDTRLVEVGPGRGALTRPLAETGARLVAVEFDRDLIGYLHKLVGRLPNVEIVNADFLTFEPDETSLPTFSLVGNLPYNITTPVLDWCIIYRRRLVRAVLMVQRELGARIAAGPHTRDWSPLAICTQLHFKVERRFDVPPDSFRPVPRVSSTVIELLPIATTVDIDLSLVSRVVRASFGHRRKLLVNNLVPDVIGSAEIAKQVLSDLSLPATCRAEELSIAQFLQLTRYLVAHNILPVE